MVTICLCVCLQLPKSLLPSASLVSLSADSATPPSSWSVSLSGNVTLPLMDLTGALVATDGYTLIGYYADGTPRGDPVQLFPTHGEVFDLNIALEKVVFILYRCGFIATYLTSECWVSHTIIIGHNIVEPQEYIYIYKIQYEPLIGHHLYMDTYCSLISSESSCPSPSSKISSCYCLSSLLPPFPSCAPVVLLQF